MNNLSNLTNFPEQTQFVYLQKFSLWISPHSEYLNSNNIYIWKAFESNNIYEVAFVEMK